MAAPGPRPAKSSRKNWQYRHIELNESHYKGINFYQCVGDRVEVTNVKPALQKNSNKAPVNSSENPSTGTSDRSDDTTSNDELQNIQQLISDIYNNSQPPDEPAGDQDEGEGITQTGSYFQIVNKIKACIQYDLFIKMAHGICLTTLSQNNSD